MERPWSSPVPPFETTSEEEIPFPADDEEIGEAMVGWRGPRYNVLTYAPFVCCRLLHCVCSLRVGALLSRTLSKSRRSE
jgi:hypothetical protein